MKAIVAAVRAGIAGSLTTNAAHELLRRARKDAPRVDILGMQALAKGLEEMDADPPVGKQLYLTTLAADLASNAAYFALVGLAPRNRALPSGLMLGVFAGLGAVFLPARLGLSTIPTNRTPLTRVLTVLLYGAGGLTAGWVQSRS